MAVAEVLTQGADDYRSHIGGKEAGQHHYTTQLDSGNAMLHRVQRQSYITVAAQYGNYEEQQEQHAEGVPVEHQEPGTVRGSVFGAAVLLLLRQIIPGKRHQQQADDSDSGVQLKYGPY